MFRLRCLLTPQFAPLRKRLKRGGLIVPSPHRLVFCLFVFWDLIAPAIYPDDQAPRHPSTREEPQDNSRMGEERTLTWEAEPEHDE